MFDLWIPMYRVVQLNLTPEIEVFLMLFEGALSILSMTFFKMHVEYFQFPVLNSVGPPCSRFNNVLFLNYDLNHSYNFL